MNETKDILQSTEYGFIISYTEGFVHIWKSKQLDTWNGKDQLNLIGQFFISISVIVF